MKRHYLLHITPHEVIVSYVSHQLRTARFLVTQFMWELTQLAKEKVPSTAPMAVQFQYRSGQSVNLCCSSRDLSSFPPGWISDRPDNYNVTVRQLDRTEHKQLKWLICKVSPEPWSCGWLVRYSYDFFCRSVRLWARHSGLRHYDVDMFWTVHRHNQCAMWTDLFYLVSNL